MQSDRGVCGDRGAGGRPDGGGRSDRAGGGDRAGSAGGQVSNVDRAGSSDRADSADRTGSVDRTDSVDRASNHSHACCPCAAPRRVVVGISGASGAIIGVRALERLRQMDVETHLVVTKAAETTLSYEAGLSLEDLRHLADWVHPADYLGAPIASGSFASMGMLVAPCSVKSLAEIAHGIDSGLLARAADVTLKERRRLVLSVRESPLTLAHIKNMEAVTLMGAIVAMPVPAFYLRPDGVDSLIDDITNRLLSALGFAPPSTRRWNGLRSVPHSE